MFSLQPVRVWLKHVHLQQITIRRTGNWQLAQLVRSFGLLFVCRSRLDCPENRTRKTAEQSRAEERNETKMCAYVSNWNCAGFVLEEHVRKSNEKHFSCKLSCRLQQYVRVTQRVSFVIQLKAKKAVPTPPLLDHLEIKANYKSPRGIWAVCAPRWYYSFPTLLAITTFKPWKSSCKFIHIFHLTKLEQP